MRSSTRQFGQSGGDRSRAQTVQDFAIGASIFLLTISFVFAFVPSIFAPFQQEVQPGSSQQASRVAATIIDEYSIPGHRNHMNSSFDDQVLIGISSSNGDELANRYGLPAGTRINIRIEEVKDWDSDGTVEVVDGGNAKAGDKFNSRAAASVSRLVVIDEYSKCSPDNGGGDDAKICRMIVRVW